MRTTSLLFFLIPLIAANFDCKISPYQLGLTCFYQNYSTVGDNYNCATTFKSDGRSYLLSLEMTNIQENEAVTVSWNNTAIGNNGGTVLSVQQYITNNVTVSITSGNNSKMTGIFFICPADVQASIPVEKRKISYGQEAFVLQQFPPASTGPGNLNVPRKWEIYVDSQVALISTGDTTNCPVDSCMQLIWIYEGSGENARFIGTAADFQNKLYLSQNTTMTLYFVTMNMGTDCMAVIANEAKNLEKCSTFDVVFYSNVNDKHTNALNVSGATGPGACLTVLNHCNNNAFCDGVILSGTVEYDITEFYAYAGAPHPDPFQAGFGLQDYSEQNIANLLPQNFVGNVRTFYIANGSAVLYFGNPNQINSMPLRRRQGFVMTNFYPFYSSNMYGGSLDFANATYSYKLTVMVNTTDAPPSSGSFLEIDVDEKIVQKINIDNTNLGSPITVPVEAGSKSRIYLWGGSQSNRGSYASYFIEAGEIEPSQTSTPSSSSTSSPTTVTRVSTIVTKSTTTTTLPTTTVAPTTTTTTTGPTDPTTTPKATGSPYFIMVTVLSFLFFV